MQKKDRPKSVSGTNEEIVYPQELVEMSDQQLLDEVDALMSLDEPSEDDTKRIEQCLALLQERAPVMEAYDAEEAWKEMIQEHPLLFQVDSPQERKKRVQHISESVTHKRRLVPRILQGVGISVALLSMIIMTAGAFGYGPAQVILKWADGVVRIYSNPSGIMELPEDSSNEYRSLSQALVENGLDDSGCPTWIPKDYEIMLVSVSRSESIDKYSAIYHSERGEVLIRVTDFKQEEWVVTDEREEGGYSQIINGIEFYFVTNLEQNKVGWWNGTCSYIISGQITDDELYSMINSIK